MMYLRPFGLHCLLLLLFVQRAVANDAIPTEQTHCRYWYGSKGNDEYNLDLIRLAFEKTAADFPAFTVTGVRYPLNPRRGVQNVARGAQVNIFATAIHDIPNPGGAQLLRLNLPIHFGLSGYHQLLINADKQAQFADVVGLDSLRAFVASESKEGLTAQILESNQLKINREIDLHNLMPSLRDNQFDFLPVSLPRSAMTLMSANRAKAPLEYAENLMIYFPQPVVFFVSDEYPEIAARLEQGLRLAKEDGSMRQLFLAHHRDLVKRVADKQTRLIVMQNPLLNNDLGLASPQM